MNVSLRDGCDTAQDAHSGDACKAGVSCPWLALFVVIVCVIWGNSLVPGEGSGSMSLAVLETLQAWLGALGLPQDWLTHFLVRKAAHFSEYLVLALVGMQAFRPHRMRGASRATRVRRALLTAAALVAVPVADETIQLFVDGRAGQVRDVLIDCAGAACGCLLTLAVHTLRRRSRGRR